MTICYQCGRPATSWINVTATAASTVPSIFKPVCDWHRPFRTEVRIHEYEDAAQRQPEPRQDRRAEGEAPQPA